MDRAVVQQARRLLESLMLRRLKTAVEASLAPKLEFVLKVPLSGLQRRWYRRVLERGQGMDDDENGNGETNNGGETATHGTGVGGVVSASQLLRRITQLQKIVNHPKCLLFQLSRDRLQLKRDLKSAEGGQYALARLEARHQRLLQVKKRHPSGSCK